MTYGHSSWLEIVGAKAPYREAVVSAFTRGVDGGTDTVEALATKLAARLSVVFCEDPESLAHIADRAAEPDRYVIGVVPDLDLIAFRNALLAGARGMIWEDTPTSHLVAVTRAALHHDILMPVDLMRMIITGEPDEPAPVDELDPMSLVLLRELASGKSINGIASKLSYSERTVQRRISNLCLALEASTPFEAIHIAHKRRWIT